MKFKRGIETASWPYLEIQSKLQTQQQKQPLSDLISPDLPSWSPNTSQLREELY